MVHIPPRVSPPTPTPASLPPTTDTPNGSNTVYTSYQVLPGPIATVLLSSLNSTMLSLAILISIPFWMLEVPASAACPPDLTTKGHCVNLDIWITVEMFRAEVTSIRHAGTTRA